jgi:hypothetical protein
LGLGVIGGGVVGNYGRVARVRLADIVDPLPARQARATEVLSHKAASFEIVRSGASKPRYPSRRRRPRVPLQLIED